MRSSAPRSPGFVPLGRRCSPRPRPADRFDFFLDHYNEQLVAGYSRNTADHSLIVMMPDYRKTGATGGKVPPPSVPEKAAR